MNDFELQSKLKAVKVPERTEEYWQDFPSRVRVQLRPAMARHRSRTIWPRLAWASAVAFGCLIAAFVILPGMNLAIKNERAFRKEIAQLPHHLRLLMADEHGMHYLIADQ